MNTHHELSNRSHEKTAVIAPILSPLARAVTHHRLGLVHNLVPALVLGASMPLQASPQGGNIVGGSGSISASDATTRINQSSDKLAINWDSFNVDLDERVHFVQPTASALVLNRILDENPSMIHGQIDANGHVLLINPQGILFSESASVNVNSLTASGLDIRPDDFMNGDFAFKANQGDAGFVINKGVINAASGVVLQGNHVENATSGLIAADMVSLAAGSETVLSFDADKLIGVKVTKDVLENQLGVNSALLNEGTIDAGEVLLTAKVAKGLFDNAVNNQGVIEAKGIDTSGGSIRLGGFGGHTADVVNTGTLDASASGRDTTGGRVQIEGDTIALKGKARIVASGEDGGGIVLIGGDVQGTNPDVHNAKNVTIESGVRIHADASQNGDGGKVIVWSDETTSFAGKITARGGEQGGDGGFVETSGKELLIASGDVDVSAEQGDGGDWLLDPYNITITNNISDDGTSNPDGSTDSQISADAISRTLGGGGTVTLRTDARDEPGEAGNITVDAAITPNIGTSNTATLNLYADNNIIFNQGLGSTNNGDFVVSLEAGNTVYIDANATLATLGGNFTSLSKNFYNLGTIDLNGLPNSASDNAVTINIGTNNQNGQAFLGNILGANTSVYAGQSNYDTFIFETGTINYSSGLSVTNGSDAENLTGAGAVALGSVSYDTNSETLTFVQNTNTTIGSLTGTGGSDNFSLGTDSHGRGYISFLGVNYIGLGAINAAGGTDTLTGSNGADTFTLQGTNNSIQALGTVFTNLEAADGSGGTDTVLGTPGNDFFQEKSSPNQIEVNGIIFDGIDYVQGGGGTNDQVEDFQQPFTYALTGQSGEFVNEGSAIQFFDIDQVNFGHGDTLKGSSTDDTFELTLKEDDSGTNRLQVIANGVLFNRRGVDSTTPSIDGGGGEDTLLGTAGDDTFTLTGSNTFTVNSNGNAANPTHKNTFFGIHTISGHGGTDKVNDNSNSNWTVALENTTPTVTDGQITLTDIDTIDTDGALTNSTGTEQNVTLSLMAGMVVTALDNLGISFEGTGDYTGHGNDTVTDTTNSNWQTDVTGNTAIQDTSGNGQTNDRSFAGISQVETTGRISSSAASSESQTVTVNDNDLSLNGITFTGATGFDGDSQNNRTDTIDDNRTTATNWQISQANGASSGSLTFADIDAVETAGHVTGRTTDSAWSLKGNKQAQSDGILFTLQGSAPEVSNVGLVTNESSTLEATLNSDSSLLAAGLTFMDFSDYIGLASDTDTLIDNRNQGWTITDEHNARSGTDLQFTNISAISNAGEITDNQNSDWVVNANSITDGHITFRGATSVDSEGAITNATGSDQNITISLMSNIVTTAFDALGISFKSAGDYTGHGADTVDDITNHGWEITTTGVQQALANNEHRGFTGVSTVTTTGSVTNVSGTELDIELGQEAGEETVSVGGITFIGSKSYQGSGLDNLEDTISREWYLTGIQNLNSTADGNGINLSGIDQFTGTGSTIQNPNVANLDVEIGADSSLTAGSILFVGANNYVGSGTDNVTDGRGKNWAITDLDPTAAVEIGATTGTGGSELSFQGIDSVTTDANVSGRDIDSTWSVSSNRAAHSDGINFTFTDDNTTITNVGLVSNVTGDGLDITLKADSSLQLAEINFADATGYQGHDKTAATDKDDAITDERNQTWTVDGDHALTSGNLTFTHIDALQTSAEVNGVAGEAWVVTEENNQTVATSNSIAFTGINQVNNAGALTNNTDTFQDVIIKGATNALELMGITFSGANHYTGHKADTGGDTVTDETFSNWRLDDDRTATQLSASRQFVNIAQIETTGSVTNGTATGQTATLKDNQITVGNITFDGSTDYTGRSGDGDHVVDETIGTGNWLAKGTGETHFDTHQLTNIESMTTSRGVTNETQTATAETVTLDDDSLTVAGIDYQGTTSYTGAGDHIDDQTTETTDWQATGVNAVSKERADKADYSLTGINSVQSDKGIANATGSDQNITISRISDIVTTAFDALGISFKNAGDYTGHGADTVNDTTNQGWEITQTGVKQDIGSSSFRNFSGINQVATTGSVTNVSGTELNVELGQEAGKETVSADGITFIGSKSYQGSGLDNLEDTLSREWYLTGIQNLNSTADGDGINLSGIDTFTGTGSSTIQNPNVPNLDVEIGADSSLTAGSILFVGANNYVGSGTDNVTDGRGDNWAITDLDPTATVEIGATTGTGSSELSFQGIDNVTTDANVSGRDIDSTWSVSSNRAAHSDGIKFTFTDDNTTITNVGLVSNATGDGLDVALKADSSLQLAEMNFADATGYQGHDKTAATDKDDAITDERNQTWTVDGDHALTSGGQTFTHIDALNTSAQVDSVAGEAWVVTEENNQTVATSNSIAFTGINQVNNAGALTNNTDTFQDVIIKGATNALELMGITFSGANHYTGHKADTGGDTVTDETFSNWRLDDDRTATQLSASRQFVNIAQIETTGSVTNGTATGQTATLKDNQITVGNITFDGSTDYTGRSGDGDHVVDETIGTGNWLAKGTGETHFDTHQLTNIESMTTSRGVTNETQTATAETVTLDDDSLTVAGIDYQGTTSYTGAGDHIDDQTTETTDWQATGVNAVSKERADKADYSLTGINSVQSDKGIANATGSDQNITISRISDIVTTAFDALGISFKNAGDYTGHGADTVNDTTNQGWEITQTGVKQDIGSSSFRNFSGINQVATTGSVTNVSGTELNVELGQEAGKETVSADGITFIGSKSYQGSGLDNLEDTLSREWYLTGIQNLNSTADGDGINLSGIDTFTGTGSSTIQNPNVPNLDVEIGADSSLTAGSILFVGANNYVGSGTDNVTDGRGDNWAITDLDPTATVEIGATTGTGSSELSFQGIDNVTTDANVSGRDIDSTWSVSSNRAAHSDGIKFTFTDDNTTITNVGLVSNATGDGLDVALKADSSLQLAEMNFADATGYQGHDKTAATDKDDAITDERNQTWTVDGDHALTSGGQTFTHIDALNTSAQVDSVAGEAWVVTEENNQTVATSNSIAFTGINQVNNAGALTNSTGTFQDVVIKGATNALELMGITFSGANHYTGHKADTGGDTVTDETFSNWRLDDDRTATQLSASRQFVNIAQIETTGSVTNGTATGQTATLKDNQITVGNITFDGSTDYTGRSGDGDHVVDETIGTGNWLAKGTGETHFDTHQLTNIESMTTSRGVTNETQTATAETVTLDDDSLTVAGIDYQGTTSYTGAGDHIDDQTTETTDWQATGVNAVSKERADKADYSLTGINSVQSDKGIANKTGSSQAVTLDDDSLTIAGIDFQGTNTRYTGDTAGDILTDSTGGSDSWSIDSERTVSKNGQSLSGIKHLKTGKNITEASTSDWEVTDTSIAYGQAHRLTVEGSSEIATTGTVSNNSQSGQNVTLADNQLTLAEMVFKGSTDYTGRSGDGDIVDDQTTGTDNWLAKGTGEAHKGNHELRNIETLKTDNGVTNDTGNAQDVILHDDRINLAGIDYQGSQDYTGVDDTVTDSTSDDLAWQIQNDAVADTLKASKNGYDLKNIARVKTDNALQNATGSSKEVTLNDSTLTVASTADNIAFEDATIYTGNSDHVIDSTGGTDLWQAKGAGSTSKGRYTLNDIGSIATTKGVQNSTGTNQTVTQARDNLTVSGIEYQGATTYTGRSNQTDVVNSDRNNWQLSGDANTVSTTNSSDQTVTFNDIGTVNTAGNGALSGSEENETFTITGANSVDTQGMTFNGVTSLDAGENTANNDTDTLQGSGETWTLTGQTNQVDAAGITASNIEQVTDTGTGNARGEVVGTSGDDEFDLNANQSPNSLIANGILFTGIDDLDGNGSLGKDIVSNDNAVWKLLKDAKAILTNGITITNINSIQDGGAGTVEGSEGVDTFTLTGTDSFDAKDISFSGISTVVGQGDDIAAASSSATIDWQLTGENNAFSVGTMNFSGIAEIEDNNQGQLTGTAGADTFNIAGVDELSTYGMDVTGIRLILAGDGADQVMGNTLNWQLGSTDNELTVAEMTFTDIEQANDDSGSGSFTGSSAADTIQWQGNSTIASRNVTFTGVSSLDGGAGDDTVYIDGEVNSLATLTGGDGSDLLVNRTPIDGNIMGWNLQRTTSTLGGQAFTSFERLSHELDTINLVTNSDIVLGRNVIRTPESLNTTIDTSAVPRFTNMELVGGGSLNGFANTDQIASTTNGGVNISTDGNLLIDDIISGGNVTVTSANGDLVVNGLVSAGGSGQVDLSSDTGSILADGAGPHIVGRDVSLTAGDTVGSQELQLLIDSQPGGTVDIIASQYVSPLFVDDTAQVTTLGERLLSVSEAVALSGFRTTAQPLVDQLGSVDPAIFTDISSFSVAENSIGEPAVGDFMLVENGNTSIQGLPVEATAAGDGDFNDNCAESSIDSDPDC